MSNYQINRSEGKPIQPEVTNYLLKILKNEGVSADTKANIALKLAEKKVRHDFINKAVLNLENGITTAIAGFTLLLLLQPGLNAMSTAWFQNLAIFKATVAAQKQVKEVVAEVIPNIDLGSKLADAAKAWIGKEYNAGQKEQCANFVREVLKEAGIDIGVTSEPIDKLDTNPALANSFFGADLGTLKYNIDELKPGDIVGFYNTYGNYEPGTITHVGIYIGDGRIVDRPTANEPVRTVEITHFSQFAAGITPNHSVTEPIPESVSDSNADDSSSEVQEQGSSATDERDPDQSGNNSGDTAGLLESLTAGDPNMAILKLDNGCTAFNTDKGLVTAQHCKLASKAKTIDGKEFNIAQISSGATHTDGTEISMREDWVVFQIDGELPKLPISSNQISTEVGAYTIGHGETGGDWQRQDGTIRVSQVHEGIYMMSTPEPITGGDSGSPVIVNGEVVGIVIRSNEAISEARVLPISFVK